MRHYEDTFKGSDGLNLYCQCWHSEGSVRAVLVIVHGLGGHSGKFSNLVETVVAKDCAVYGYDMRGNGRSPGQRGYINAWSEFRDDLRLFLKWIKTQEPGKPVFLLGHSVGAVVVADYGLQCPDEAAALHGVILSAPILGQTGVSPLKMAVGRLLSQVWPRFSLNTGLGVELGTRNPAMLAVYADDPLRHARVSARFGTEFLKTVAWIHAHAADWRLPLLILHGSGDRVALPEGGQRFFQNAGCLDKERREYANAYHELFDDVNYQEVLADLNDWIDQHLLPYPQQEQDVADSINPLESSAPFSVGES
jgi:alpha-beta hydrolase superfamily lysophospholipase